MPQPRSVAAMLEQAVRLHRRGEGEAAEALYDQILSTVPDQPDALHFLGVLRHQQGRSDEAIDLLRDALAAAPDYVDAWNNLGNIQKENGGLEAAEAAYREALARNHAHPGVWNNLGVVLRARGACREAIAALRRVLELAPNSADAYYNLANALRECGDVEEAISAYRQALSLNPGNATINVQFGYLLYITGRHGEATALFGDWLAVEPDNPIAAHMLAACSGEAVPQRASDDYVRYTFDKFADSFDEQLLQKLDYHAPELVAASLAEVLGAPQGDLGVLDAGCGTGLCGPLLRPYARYLTGMDLSPGMLAKAQARGSYDRLHEAELTAFLVAHEAAFDVVASADTLVYFGALEPVISAARKALKPGGWLVFSVERAEGEIGFRINPHGRYSHTETYLRHVLGDAGFTALTIAPAVLRQELKQPVHGWVVRAQSPHDPDNGHRANAATRPMVANPMIPRPTRIAVRTEICACPGPAGGGTGGGNRRAAAGGADGVEGALTPRSICVTLGSPTGGRASLGDGGTGGRGGVEASIGVLRPCIICVRLKSAPGWVGRVGAVDTASKKLAFGAGGGGGGAPSGAGSEGFTPFKICVKLMSPAACVGVGGGGGAAGGGGAGG